MTFDSIPMRNAQVAKLMTYFEGQPDGEELPWLRIESETDVKMNTAGKSLARRALSKLKRPHVAVRAVGLRLSSASNTIEIMNGRFVKIDNSVRKADSTRKHLSERHFEQLDNADKNRMLVLAGFFGAVRAYTKEASGKLLK